MLLKGVNRAEYHEDMIMPDKWYTGQHMMVPDLTVY